MTRPFLRTLLICTTLALTAPAPAAAATVTEQIVTQLSRQGFDQITVSRTLLGRTRIQATSRDFEREIVVNPATGEILRDYIVRRKRGSGSGSEAPRIVDPYDDDDGNGNSGNGGGGGGYDDDEDDDAEDDDGGGNSGSGGGNSGPGGGGDDDNGGDDDDDDDDDDDE